VLAWRLLNMLGSDFCVRALESPCHGTGKPEIQGGQFTSTEFTGVIGAARNHLYPGYR